MEIYFRGKLSVGRRMYCGTVSDPGYRLYSFVILHTIPVRVTLKKAYLKAGRLLKRVRRRLIGKR